MNPTGTDVLVAPLTGMATVGAFAATVATLHAQRASEWRAVLVAPTPELVLELQSLVHPRISVHHDREGRGWLGALRSGRAPRVTVLDAGDELTGLDVLARIDLELDLTLRPDGTVIYTDEMIPGIDGDEEGRRKPGFDPATAAAVPIYHRLASWPRPVLEHASTPNGSAPAGEDVLRAAVDAAARAGARFVHLPRPGVRARVARNVITPTGSSPTPPSTAPDAAAAVSVVIPTAGSRRQIDGEDQLLVRRCLDGLLHRTDHPVAEVVIVLGDNAPAGLREELLDYDERIRTVHVPGPFHFARAINTGAALARSPWLLLLNDDIEVRDGDWLGRLLSRAAGTASAPDTAVGAVGAKLLFPDGRIQHAGVAHHDDGIPLHLSIFEDDVVGGETTSRFALAVTCPFDAVTGAAMVVRTADFDLVGGMSPTFPLNFNDTDLCLKLSALGRRSVLEPRAVLTHRESSTRTARLEESESATYRARWADLLRVGSLRQWHVP